ncbi:hypothetical protein [Edaphobacter aggregans]|uniref:hypothetical protein n=1 Tax=Edaphobacter aggregans TaxID=570835 RepID=UPI0014701DB7|nr:hypothetical protein [Edaphobacter aggregans]
MHKPDSMPRSSQQLMPLFTLVDSKPTSENLPPTEVKQSQYVKSLIPILKDACLLALFVCAYLYSRLFYSPGVPYLVTADQTFFWQYALRMSNGEHVYRDFFQFTPPGLDLYFLALFRLFDKKIWVTSLAAILLGVALSVICFTLASKFMRRSEALLTAMFFIVLVYGGRLDVTHHWFSLIAALGATRLVMESRSVPRLVGAGILLAVASSFTQTAGVAVGVGMLLVSAWEHNCEKSCHTTFRNQSLLLVSFCTAWLVLNAYFLATAGFKALWYFQVIYPWHYIDHTRGFLIPSLRGIGGLVLIQRLFIYILLVSVYPLVFWGCWRNQQRGSREGIQSLLLATAGLFLLLSVITRSNWTRLYAVSMPAIILWMRFLLKLTPHKLRRWTILSLYGATVCLAALQVRSVRRQQYTMLKLHGGTMAIAHTDVEEFQWLEAHTKPGEDFFQATWPSMYLPLGLRSPVFVETLLPERTSPEFAALTIQQIEQSQLPYILWSPWLQPDSKHPEADNLQRVRDYIKNHYVRIQVFANRDEMWQLK